MHTFLGSLPELKRHSESLSDREGYRLGLGETRERERKEEDESLACVFPSVEEETAGEARNSAPRGRDKKIFKNRI